MRSIDRGRPEMTSETMSGEVTKQSRRRRNFSIADILRACRMFWMHANAFCIFSLGHVWRYINRVLTKCCKKYFIKALDGYRLAETLLSLSSTVISLLPIFCVKRWPKLLT